MAIGIVFFWLVIVVGIVALIQFSSRQSRMRAVPRAQVHKESAEQLLAIRFAHGEIDESEYRQRLAVLRGSVRR